MLESLEPKLSAAYSLCLEIREIKGIKKKLRAVENIKNIDIIEAGELLRFNFKNSSSLKFPKIEKNRNVKFEKEILKFIAKINNRAPYLEDYHGFSYINYVDDLLQYNDLEPHKKEALKNFKITHDENFELDTIPRSV